MNRFEQSTAWAPPSTELVPPGQQVVTEVPARPAGFISDVTVPFVQSVITGLLLASLVVFIVARFDWPGNLLTLWVGAWLIISTLAWVLLLIDHRRLLWAIERLIGSDLDGDGEMGKPPKRTLEVALKTGASTMFVDTEWLEIDDDSVLAFCIGLENGRGLSEAEWGNDKVAFPKGMNEYRKFRTRISDAGLIRKVNPNATNSPYEVTPAGNAVFGRFAEYAHTHTHATSPSLAITERVG